VATTYSNRNYRPVRKLIVFAIIIAALYALMALTHSWTPRLGLDLRGGSTVTLTAKAPAPDQGDASTPASPSSSATPASTTPASVEPTTTPGASSSGAPATTISPVTTPAAASSTARSNWSMASAMQQAQQIIEDRVNSLGVGESTVTLQGSDQIVVSVPNIGGTDLVQLVGTTAELAFRDVYQTAAVAPAASASPSVSVSTAGASATGTPATAAPTSSATTPAASSASRRVMPGMPTAPPAPRPTEATTNPNVDIQTLLNWQPSDQDLSDFQSWTCGQPFPDVWDQPLFACSQDKTTKYLLGPQIISGQDVVSATAGIPQGQLTWEVDLSFNADGTSRFTAATTHLYQNSQSDTTGVTAQFAIVLDGEVISAPIVQNGPITGGNASISGGGINQNTAQNLARVLQYGSLPLTFEVSNVDMVSPTLGGEQLKAGIIAGIIGLVLVLIYSMIYYRALSVIVWGSLASAALITYAAVVLLGQTISFALSLPGIAGVIMAIGVTADSFIVYFERIRDEIREGFSLQHSVESGWTKARGTIVIADSVQLLSAIVLFILSISSVKGFAFTLFVTTAIDLFIVFFFSKPLMTLLARTDFFASGHPLSGFDPAHLGVTPEALRGRRISTRSSVAPSTIASAGKEA